MSKLSSKLGRDEGGHTHWCPGCGEHHRIPDSWKYDGNIESPTFSPSVKISWEEYNYDVEPVNGKYPLLKAHRCHYNLTAGVLVFHGDSLHSFAGKCVPLPDLPPDS